MRHIFVLLLAMALVGSSTPSWAASSSSSSAAEVGYGAGAALGTLVYVPFKATFCILGGIGAAGTAIVSTQTAGKVVSASCRGRSEEHTSELQSHLNLVCRLLLE